jgi:hypothetical protein
LRWSVRARIGARRVHPDACRMASHDAGHATARRAAGGPLRQLRASGRAGLSAVDSDC